MTHASLFSGIGGFDLAAERAGFQNVFQVENNPWCLSVLEKNFPDILRGIKEINPRFIIAGNVAGIVRMALDQVLFDLESIRYTPHGHLLSGLYQRCASQKRPGMDYCLSEALREER